MTNFFPKHVQEDETKELTVGCGTNRTHWKSLGSVISTDSQPLTTLTWKDPSFIDRIFPSVSDPFSSQPRPWTETRVLCFPAKHETLSNRRCGVLSESGETGLSPTRVEDDVLEIRVKAGLASQSKGHKTQIYFPRTFRHFSPLGKDTQVIGDGKINRRSHHNEQ